MACESIQRRTLVSSGMVADHSGEEVDDVSLAGRGGVECAADLGEAGVDVLAEVSHVLARALTLADGGGAEVAISPWI